MNYFRVLISGILACVTMMVITIVALILFYSYHTPYIIITTSIFVILFDLCFAIVVINSKRQTSIKLCWVFFIAAIPLIGVLSFLIFGFQPYTQKNLDTYQEKWKPFLVHEDFNKTKKIISEKVNLHSAFNYNFNAGLSAIYENNKIEIVDHITNSLETTIKLIRSAKKFIHYQTYIIHDGAWFRIVCEELINQAKKGIEVCLLYDWVGSYHLVNRKLLKKLKQNYVKVGVFNPKGINMFKGVTNYRSHQKCLIIDNHTCYYGGSNTGDEYLGISAQYTSYQDLNYLVSGAIVNSINLNFIYNWKTFSDQAYKNPKFSPMIDQLHKVQNEQLMQLVKSSPDYEEKTIEKTILSLIYSAKKSIKITTPYFFPSDEILHALQLKAYSGIEIDLILPSHNNEKEFVIITNRKHYEELKKAGVKIYEYQGFIHSKYMIIDNNLVFTGSNNLDYRSLWINFENALLIHDQLFTKQMNDIFNHDLSHCKMINEIDIKTFTTLKFKITNLLVNLIHPLI